MVLPMYAVLGKMDNFSGNETMPSPETDITFAPLATVTCTDDAVPFNADEGVLAFNTISSIVLDRYTQL